MRRQSEVLLLLPLLPILIIGAFPMLLLALLGFVGLGIAGVLMMCAGLADRLDADRNFNREVIVHGYAHRSEREIDASNRHSDGRFAALVSLTGAALTVTGLVGFLYFG
jgi:hypothetical protein